MNFHPYGGGKSPFAIVFGDDHSFFHPALEEPKMVMSLPKYLQDRFDFMRKITNRFRDHYDLLLSQRKSKKHTVYSLNMKVGDNVFYKIHQWPASAAFLHSIMPRYKIAEIIKIVGAVTLLLRDNDSGREISRNLTDCYKMSDPANFSNLYLTPDSSFNDDFLEEQTDMTLQETKDESAFKNLQNKKEEEFKKTKATNDVPPVMPDPKTPSGELLRSLKSKERELKTPSTGLKTKDPVDKPYNLRPRPKKKYTK